MGQKSVYETALEKRERLNALDHKWPSIKIDSFKDYVSKVQELTKLADPNPHSYWFRGQSNKYWGLKPSFMRITEGLVGPEEALELERVARNEFKYNAHFHVDHRLLEKVKTNPCWWAIMQHHGAPTRLLDWSTSAYVAAYFAAQQDNSGEEGVVWAFCDTILENEFEKNYKIELNKRCPKLKLKKGQSALPDFTKTEETDNRVGALHQLAETPDVIRAVAPLRFQFASSERMAKQQGAFTMCLRIHEEHDCIADILGTSHVKRFVIPQDIKPDFLLQLRMMNITALSMFPGIDGLGRSVAERASLGKHSKRVCQNNGALP